MAERPRRIFIDESECILVFVPDDGIGHSETTEAVGDEGRVSDTDVREELSQVGYGEERHIVASCPTFTDPGDKAIKVPLGEEEVKERDAGMELDRKMTVGRGEIAPSTDSVELGKEATLVIKVANVFDDGVGVAHIKTILRKGKSPTITRDGRDKRIAGAETGYLGIASHADRGNFFGMLVKLFEIVVGI